MTGTNPFIAKWSADGHTMCLGHWQISYQGLPCTIPAKYAEKDMGTYGNFSYFYPDDDAYIEGEPFADWIDSNVDWLMDVFMQHNIPVEVEYFQWFYEAVNLNDWRCSSCGGCM
ncbi:hypothetical protein FE810_06930 [Thalassotalea litorea]|uniref:Uncharacterized protein n=1 Tax=Thalassotalea litorea TaxID=2020715 RepID=A0A5R9ILK5_9GAMM|nr:hypothetical protein [Thalassotalea litorea]TLU66415.1 hypothetical protein FE810_06930 [Thalassotalea litorea]